MSPGTAPNPVSIHILNPNPIPTPDLDPNPVLGHPKTPDGNPGSGNGHSYVHVTTPLT